MNSRSSSATALPASRPARPFLYPLAALCAIAASGCTHVTLVDDVDLVLDWQPLTGPGNALNSPYVEGSAMRIYVSSSDHGEKYVGWHVTSAAPSVFSVDALEVDNNTQPVTAFLRGHALGPGSAELQVFNGNDQYVGGDTVEVKRPDEIRLLAHGLLLVGQSDDQARVAELRVLQGGTATYLARYFAGGQELHGNGALSVPTATPPISPPVGGTAAVANTFLFEDRDWLQLSPQSNGSAAIDLEINGTPFGDFPVVAVPASDVVAVHILGEPESPAKSGDWLVTFAQSVDANSRAIYGAQYTWQIDSATQDSLGDLFRYQYDPRQPKMLTASFGGMSAQTLIHAEKGYVDSTNHVGCAIGHARAANPGPGPGLTAVSLFALLVGLYGRRQRRRRPAARMHA